MGWNGYELTKLASKIVRLWEFAGIYYRSDYVESIIIMWGGRNWHIEVAKRYTPQIYFFTLTKLVKKEWPLKKPYKKGRKDGVNLERYFYLYFFTFYFFRYR